MKRTHYFDRTGYEKSGSRVIIDGFRKVGPKESLQTFFDDMNCRKNVQVMIDGYEKKFDASVTQAGEMSIGAVFVFLSADQADFDTLPSENTRFTIEVETSGKIQ